jgi:hypothetical protein
MTATRVATATATTAVATTTGATTTGATTTGATTTVATTTGATTAVATTTGATTTVATTGATAAVAATTTGSAASVVGSTAGATAAVATDTAHAVVATDAVATERARAKSRGDRHRGHGRRHGAHRAWRAPGPLRDAVSRTGRRVASARARAVGAVSANRSSHPRRQDYPPHAARQCRSAAGGALPAARAHTGHAAETSGQEPPTWKTFVRWFQAQPVHTSTT